MINLPCRCHRFKCAKGRNDAIQRALAEEYDECFAQEWAQKHRRIIAACKDAAVAVALSTILPLAWDAVHSELQETHVVVDAVAYRFCVYLRDTWFSIDNNKLQPMCAQLMATRKAKTDTWVGSQWAADADSPKGVMAASLAPS